MPSFSSQLRRRNPEKHIFISAYFVSSISIPKQVVVKWPFSSWIGQHWHRCFCCRLGWQGQPCSSSPPLIHSFAMVHGDKISITWFARPPWLGCCLWPANCYKSPEIVQLLSRWRVTRWQMEKRWSPIFVQVLYSMFSANLLRVRWQIEDISWTSRTDTGFDEVKGLILRTNSGHR